MADVQSAVNNDNNADPGLGERIIAALESAEIPPERWTPDILGPADQIHGGGLLQTRLHADLTNISGDMHLLEVARTLTDKVGLSNRVEFNCGDATDLPYKDEAFDMAWALNVTINIEDRARFYAGVYRVLKPGGLFAASELGQGPNGVPYYPLPWARDPSYSFLIPPDEMRAILEDAGFRIVEWIDEAARRQAAMDNPPPPATPVDTPLTIEITRGEDYPERRKNSGRSAKEGRLTNVMLVAEKI